MRARSTRRSLWITVATIAVLSFGAVILANPALLDLLHLTTPLERKISDAVRGKMTWDSLQVRMLPVPRGEFRNVRISDPGVGHAHVDRAIVYLRLSALLLGQVEIDSVTAVRPVIELDMAPSPSQHRSRDLDLIAAYRSVMEPVVKSVDQIARGGKLEVEDGQVTVRGADLQVTHLTVHARTSREHVEVEATTASNPWGRLHLTAQIQIADLSGNATLEINQLKPQRWLDRLSSDTGLAVTIGAVDAQLQARTDAKSSMQSELALTGATLQIARGSVRLDAADFAVRGRIVSNASRVSAELSEVRMGTLLPAARVALSATLAGTNPDLMVEIPRADLGVLRDAALLLMTDEVPARRDIERLRAGELTDVKLEAAAESFSVLGRPPDVTASARITHGAVVAPLAEQEATAVAGEVRLAGGKLTLEGAAAQLGRSKVTEGTLRYSLTERTLSGSAAFDVALPQAIELARTVLPRSRQGALADVQSVSGGIQARVTIAADPREWRLAFDVTRSDCSLRLRQLPWPIALGAGRVSVSPRRIRLEGGRGSIGKWPFADVTAELTRGGALELNAASGQVDVSLDELHPWLRSQQGLAKAVADVTAASGTLAVTLNRLSGPLSDLYSLDYDVSVRPQGVRLQSDRLPAPLELMSGSMRIDRGSAKVDRLLLSILDAQAAVSGTIEDYRGGKFKTHGDVLNGSIGPAAMDWIWKRAGWPPRLQPRTPVGISAQEVIFVPQEILSGRAAVQFGADRTANVDLSWAPRTLDIRRLNIQDQQSDAVLGLSLRDRVLQASFSGSLSGSSLAAMLSTEIKPSGSATGDLRFTFDREQPQRSTAQGHLEGFGLDLSGSTGQPVQIEHIDVVANGSALQINSTLFEWAEQRASLRGEVKLTDQGPVIDAQLDSPGIMADALWESFEKAATPPASAAGDRAPPDQAATGVHIWPLPVTGQLSWHAAFIDYNRYRIAPVSAIITLEENRVQIDVQEAQLCGISFPGSTVLTPQGATTRMRIAARHQQLESAIGCLSGETEMYTGEFNLQADLSVNGIHPQIPRDLEGTIQFESHKGEVRKAPRFAGFLNTENIAAAFERGAPRLDREALRYRRIKIDGRFREQRFIADEIAFDSDAVGIGATGSIDLSGSDTDMVVLVAPFSRANRLVRAVPLLGYVFGGTFTTVPVSVRGDIRKPLIVPLGPEAITSELFGIFERTLRVPSKLLDPLGTTRKDNRRAAPQ